MGKNGCMLSTKGFSDMFNEPYRSGAFVRAGLLSTTLAIALSATMLAGCSVGSTSATEGEGASSAQAESSQAYTFTDDMGNEVTVENPQRVVACMGSFANTWELAGGTLVGASDDAFTFDAFDIASPDVAKVGDFSSINLEAVIALEPDFVIMTCGTGGRGGDSSQADFKAALDASGIPVAYFEATVFEDYLRMLRVFCDITGRDDLYSRNGESVQQAIEQAVSDMPEASEPSTALLMTTYSRGTRVLTSSSMAGDMLADLGVVNLADENRSLLSDFSLESVIELDPDYIFVIPMGNDTEAAMRNLEAQTAENPAWATLSAVQEGRYIMLDPDLFLYKPNAKWAQSYETLAGHLAAGQNEA